MELNISSFISKNTEWFPLFIQFQEKKNHYDLIISRNCLLRTERKPEGEVRCERCMSETHLEGNMQNQQVGGWKKTNILQERRKVGQMSKNRHVEVSTSTLLWMFFWNSSRFSASSSISSCSCLFASAKLTTSWGGGRRWGEK